MRHDLSDPYLKTVRAKEHLDAVRKQLAAFYKSKPYRFAGEDDLENQRYVLRVEIQDAPATIPLIVGDFFYCLRSSLDQLVWSLARLTFDYPERTQFPIFDAPNPEKFAAYTKGIPARAAAMIETLQPYHGPDAMKSHHLWRLNKMCNVDKHRRIPTHASIMDFKLRREVMRIATFETRDDCGVVSIPLSAKGQMQIHPQVTPQVTFGDAHEGLQLILDDIVGMYEFVAKKVIPPFGGFFS